MSIRVRCVYRLHGRKVPIRLSFRSRLRYLHGSTVGMPALEVYRGSDEELMIFNGVTRATRVAKLLPGVLIRVEVLDDLRILFGHLPTVKDQLP